MPRWGRHPVPDPHMHIPLSVRALCDGSENARERARARHAHHAHRTLRMGESSAARDDSDQLHAQVAVYQLSPKHTRHRCGLLKRALKRLLN